MQGTRKAKFGYVLLSLFQEELEFFLDDMKLVPEPGEVVDHDQVQRDFYTDMNAARLIMKQDDVSLVALFRIYENINTWSLWWASRAETEQEQDRLLDFYVEGCRRLQALADRAVRIASKANGARVQ
jgi:hypothetical protein